MAIKVSFPFGKKHPVVAVVLLAILALCTIWSVWHSIDRGVLGGRHMTVYDHPGFEFFLALRILAAIGLLALIIKVVRDAIAARSRKGS